MNFTSGPSEPEYEEYDDYEQEDQLPSASLFGIALDHLRYFLHLN